MTEALSLEQRKDRVNDLCHHFGLNLLPLSPPLSRPAEPPTFKTLDDDIIADHLIKRQRQFTEHQHSGSLRKTFTPKKRTWDSVEIYRALTLHVTNGGSAGVAESLINKLESTGGNVNVPKPKGGFLRRKGFDLAPQPSQILLKAVESAQVEVIQVLLPHVNAASLDVALPVAIRSGNLLIVKMLLQYGANAIETTEGLVAFRNICALGGQSAMVAMIVNSPGRPSFDWVNQGLIDATNAGCLPTVRQLIRAGGDANSDNAAALKAAVKHCRADIAVALIASPKHPQQPGVNEAFLKIFSHPTIGLNDKLQLAEVILLGGATGSEVASSLIQAYIADFVPMVQLLLAFQASIEYQDAFVLRDSVKKGRLDMVELLLGTNSSLSSMLVSECVQLIPKKIQPKVRQRILKLLLERGATGECLHEILIVAAESGDLSTTALLLSSISPVGTLGSQSGHIISQNVVFSHHKTATVNYKDGQALQVAVTQENTEMVRLLLRSNPAAETLAAVFPYTQRLPPESRYEITEAFLSTGLRDPVINTAFHDAIAIPYPDRDGRLVSLFLDYRPDIDDKCILTAVSLQDVQLLQALIKKGPSSNSLTHALPKAVEIFDPEVRFQIVKTLLGAGANSSTNVVSNVLIMALKSCEVNEIKFTDEPLVTLLLKQGRADINHRGGLAVEYAIKNHNPAILDIILRNSTPLVDTLTRALRSFTSIDASPSKLSKLESVLAHCRPNMIKDGITELLIHEVNVALAFTPGQRPFGIVKLLLSAGADINMQNAIVLQEAVRCADLFLLEILLTLSANRPTGTSLGRALLKAVMIRDPMGRLAFTQRLLDEGVPAHEINEALVYSIKMYPEDLMLIQTLVPRADTSNAEALSAAVEIQKVEFVSLIIKENKFGEVVLSKVFADAVLGVDKNKRIQICMTLIGAGVRGVMVSDALITAAAQADLGLAALLLENGADINGKGGQALIAACQTSSIDVLGVLLSNKQSLHADTLIRGFQAASELGDLEKREKAFRVLLQRGISGEVLDEQLISSTRIMERGIGLVKLLLFHGASVDYNGGEAVQVATQTSCLPIIELLLGIQNLGGKQCKPSQKTLAKALAASVELNCDSRLIVTTWLFQAGLDTEHDINVALKNVVKEEVPDEPLIDLLLEHGASPLADGCQAFIDATRRLLPSVLEKFMKLDVPESDISWIFANGFTCESIPLWLSHEGLKIVHTLLQRGATGDGPATTLVTVIDMMTHGLNTLAGQFVDLMLEFKVDVNYRCGLALQKAMAYGDHDLVRKIIQRGKPDSKTISAALPYVFDLNTSEDDTLAVLNVFANYCESEIVDIMTTYPDKEPLLVQALSQYPRSTLIFNVLLDMGCFYDQTTIHRVSTDVEAEEVSILLWCLLQPQKKISDKVLHLLIEERYADPNFTTSLTNTTPLMVAVSSGREQIVLDLLVAGADPTAQDFRGTTPVALASALGTQAGKTIMKYLLKVNPSVNDGSLHTAAAKLDYDTIELLLEAGHEPDFPSTLHDGRSALAEAVFHGSISSGKDVSGKNEKAMEKIITLLLKNGSDPTIQSHGRSVMLLALMSPDPVPTTRILLKCGLWKEINSPAHQFKDEFFVYSPTQYIARILKQTRHTDELLRLLRNNRAKDTFYAHIPNAEQPPGTINLPAHLEQEEHERRSRIQAIHNAEEHHELTIRRTKELAAVQAEVWTQQADLEDTRTLARWRTEIENVRERARIADEVFAGELARERAKRAEQLAHERKLTAAAGQRADAERSAEEGHRRKMLEWMTREDEQKVQTERRLREMRLSEKEETERIDRGADERIKMRISEQRRLVESQSHLAGKLQQGGIVGSAPVRRQIDRKSVV